LLAYYTNVSFKTLKGVEKESAPVASEEGVDTRNPKISGGSALGRRKREETEIMKKLHVWKQRTYCVTCLLYLSLVLPTVTPVSEVNSARTTDNIDLGTLILWSITMLILLCGCAGMVIFHRHLNK
jgi:hypothetical protein